ENLADEKKEQLAQLSSMVDEIDDMDEQESSAKQNDSLDMSDFKDLVGVSDDDIAKISDEISEISEVKGEISKVAEIAEASDEVVTDEIASDNDSLDMSDFKELVGVSDKAETKEESTNEVARLEEIAEDVAPADEIEALDEVVADEMPTSSKLSQEERIASLKEEIAKAEEKTAAVTGEPLGNKDIELSEVADDGADEIASDDDIAKTSDEISEIRGVSDEISKVAGIAKTSDEVVTDEIVTDEIASDDGIAKTSDEVASGDDEFAGISESDLAGALGLDIAGLSSEQEKPKEQTNNADIEQVKSQISSQITETIGATLASSPALKEAIKGMKIKINISFEE
ncbi:hypothetical protein, partial [Campylobacter sp.]|uniref:hypothetical protein n=1 Tax=Campylobacter sp. TaxID=205 RepID=UPI002AA95C4E